MRACLAAEPRGVVLDQVQVPGVGDGQVPLVRVTGDLPPKRGQTLLKFKFKFKCVNTVSIP